MSNREDRRNHRIVRSFSTFDGVDAQGNPIQFDYVGSESSAYDHTCPQCGGEVTRVGIIGALFDDWRNGLCDTCWQLGGGKQDD